ncbi:POTE ankyrin domain family member E-like isoform X7 [Myxocyprinus asiaticus]|uniref:POTE ankyrin domain family member E-like isoform X7 n=1 Tax=Myxocyprinus asiaticus TaxID=70543 RepID=UPI00222386F9|nr:POTE ankyrin domain family member E-like isoform X7 [Myxocyprinus asiaticus]
MTHRETPANMSNSRTEVQRSPPSSNLPADHVLNSGAVIFPGAFDQHGCPLVIFPVESQCKLSQEVSREEVSHFIHYCLRLHNKGEASLVSVVVDLRQANVTIARFIGEALLLLEFCRRIIHSVYIVQPKKKDVLKQLGKILTPNGSKQHRPILFKLVFLKDVFELSNYIDKSQLTSSLGGYLLYCHTSWVVFIKEIDGFVQEFLSVVNRLPSCISTLQSLAKLPVPADHERLQNFCSVNEARFRHLRRDLGLDDLLKHCECLLKKLHFPENEPCFHAMAGTLLFSHTALEMLHNYNRITAAVEKVELLWQQAFFRARLQLQILHLQREAQQIQEQIIELHREKLQPYRIHVSRDAHSAEILRLEFEGSIYTHAMALVRHAEDVIHTFTETIPLTESRPREQWVDDLERLKENLYTAVQRPYQTLRTVSNFHHTCNRCKNWYNLVLCETFLQDLLWSGSCGGPSEISSSPDLCTDLPPWRRGVETFLRRNPCPEVQELVKLSHLANFITDPYLQHTGKQLTHRLDASVNDWVHREQQELKEVEETLDRAAEILQEEESVLAQEVLLDDLLKTEDLHKHWPLWNREDQHSLMSSKDLSESVVIGLDDDSELSSLHSEILKTSEICENCPDSPGLATECLAHVNEPVQLDTRCPKVDRSGILQELKDLQALEEQIMKETLKLDALRCSEAEVFLSEHLSQALVMTQSSYRERERRMMHAHLEEETREVEEMERSLSREMEKARKVRKRSSKGHKVVKCSIMEKNSKLKDLDDELLRNCRLQQQSIQNLESDHYKPLLIPASEQSNPQKSPCSASEESSNDIPQYSATEECPFLRLQWKDFEERASHALPNQAENEVTNPQDLHLASGPLGTIAPSKSVPNTSLSEHCEVETVAASSTQKTNHEQGAFDPGGMLLATPVPAPRSAFPLDGKQTQINSEKSASAGDNTARQGQSESGVSVLYDNITPKSRERTNPPLSKTQGLQMHNSNNNKSPPVQPVLYSDISETQENSTQRECYHEDSEVAGQYLCHVQNKNGVQYDGGGSTRAVCKSPLNQLQLHTFTRQMTDYKTTIVLDTGSGLMKAGFADQDLPTTVFPTVIGHPKYEEIMNGSVDREVYIGHDAQHMRGVLTLKYPIRSGVVRNWDEMEMIWHHAFQQLGVDSEDHPVLLTEAAMNPVQNRQRMVELMFEAFNVPLTFVAMQAVLALYASGRTTGVVFDSGDGVSHSVPVFEGYCLPHAVQHFNLAGADVTLQLQKLLLEQGVCMRTSAEQEIVREIKERCCCVALDYEDEFRSGGTSSQVHYTLPDGQLISLATERFRAPEILFKPELIGRDHYGLHESIFKSILRSDIDLRRSFVGNIVLSGGNTLLSGLPERLQKEMRNMVPADLTECVRVTSPSDRDFSVWCGGAVLANLPAFTSAWIGAEEYEEFGPQIVFRKCF